MYGFMRVAAAVPDVSIGDSLYNADKIIEKMHDAEEKNVNITAFPELCVTGYSCADLFFQSALQQGSLVAIKRIVCETESMSGCFAIGAPLTIESQLYNCALLISKGKILGIAVKTFIPNHNEFYERRWFSSSENLSCEFISSTEIGLDEKYDIPVGRNLIFNFGESNIAIEICEDMLTPLSPATFAALDGAEVILNLSASSEAISKHKNRVALAKNHSASCICAYIYVSAGSLESTTDLVFSGHSMICENGSLLIENKNLIDSNYLIVSDIDVQKLKSDRKKFKNFADASRIYGNLEKSRKISSNISLESDGSLYKLKKFPFVPTEKEDKMVRCMEIFQMQVSALKKRMSVAGSNLVVGVSGGLDSTLALLVSVEAVKQLGFDADKVVGITMPCFGTSNRTYENSLKLMASLNISTKEINIKNACTLHCQDIGHDVNDFNVTFENIQARERTQILMDYACKIGGFVVGTGDLSELALGWCTYNADHMSMYGVNASVPKTLMRCMIESIIEHNIFPDSAEVLKDIVDTPISPELIPPDEEGKIVQETENIIGPYALHDFFLYNMIRYAFSPKKIYHLACKAFKDDFDSATILKWEKTFYRRFFVSQFKRSCVPDGVKIGSVSLSPRGDWRMPSDASFKLWLSELDEI